MSNVFNTPFENSLRVLLVLTASKNNTNTDKNFALNIDMISALDFITIYGKSIGYHDKDLHGQNPFSFSEYTAKRELIIKALKDLVMRGLVDIVKDSSGILYKINKTGYDKVALSLVENNYAEEYMNSLEKSMVFIKGKTEQEIVARISEKATQKTRGSNG